MILYVDQLANTIRTIDGNNDASPHELGKSVAAYLRGGHVITTDAAQSALAEFVRDTNPDKRLGVGALAEKILDHLGLDLNGQPA